MINKVSELCIVGEAVHDIEFLKDESYYPQILITRMEARYFFKAEITTVIMMWYSSFLILQGGEMMRNSKSG